MKNKALIIIVCSCLLLCGCAKTITRKSTDIETVQTEAENYEGYSGLWSENGLSHNAVISNGGVEFSIEITDKNNLNGYLFTQQGTSDRIAEIDNITGKIDNDEFNYEYNDDGWGGSGILHITFRDDTIQIEVQNYKMRDTNLSGYGISGVYQLKQSKENETEKSESDMLKEIEERKQYREKCSFYSEVEEYLENVREVTDISSLVEPLYYTDMKIYQKQDFDQVPPLIIHLAKNEIYARHGYIFKSEDLNNYFKGQIWYEPSVSPENFKDSLFNKNEQENLKLLSGLDTYK
ncbi:YARHG domain-containing protein [Lacrimispora sp. JR3]|uniref:YARHG domain-containing protein n=1 Tax=Lacrimispora sinapis TaxID=3111456 RepID=UPI00374979C4